MLLWPALGNPLAYPALVLVLGSLFLGIRRQDLMWVLRQRWVQLLLLAFILIALAFTLNARNGGEYGYALDFLILPFSVPIALLALHLGPGFNVLRLAQLCLASAAIALVVGFYGFFILSEPRASGFELSPIQFADLAIIMGFMALGGFFVADVQRHFYLLLGPAFGLVAAVLAGTRGALLVAAALAVIFAAFFLLRHPASRSAKLRIMGLLLALAALGLVAAVMVGGPRFFDAINVVGNMASGKQIDLSSAYRLQMYSSGLRAFWDAPIIGHGWTHQMEAAFPYMNEIGQAGYKAENWGYIHNEALSFAVGGGILGFLAYVLWMVAPFIGLRSVPADSQSTARAYLIAVLVIGLVVAGLTEVLLMSELSKTLMVFLVAAILVACRDTPPVTAGDAR